MKPTGPFKHTRVNRANDGDVYTATFSLANDGSHLGERRLRINVITHANKPTEIVLDVLTVTGDHRVLAAETGELDNVGRLLQGTATVVTTTVLRPIVEGKDEGLT